MRPYALQSKDDQGCEVLARGNAKPSTLAPSSALMFRTQALHLVRSLEVWTIIDIRDHMGGLVAIIGHPKELHGAGLHARRLDPQTGIDDVW